MKKVIHLSMFAACLGFVSCAQSEYDIDRQIPDMYNKILYLQTNGKQELTLYDTGDRNLFNYSIIKSGAAPGQTATADVEVLTQEELDEQYGQLEGVNYKLLNTDAYSIENGHVEFAAEDEWKTVTISVDPDAVKADMEADPTAVWVLPLYVTSETDSINANRDDVFLQFTSIIAPSVQFSNTNVTIVEKQYGIGTFTMEAPFKLDVENTNWDITCDFTVDAAYVDTYNEKNGTSFKLLDANYSFNPQVSLPKGTTELPLTVTIEGGNLQPGDYMLPIRLSGTSLFSPTEGKDLCVLAFRIVGTQLARTGWTVTASSQTVEASGNGAASNVFDGDISTYWHSKWEGGFAPLPHSLTIDTQATHTFSQVSLQRRIGVVNALSGHFYVSNDGDSWEEVGTFVIADTDEAQLFSVIPTEGRYVKVEVTKTTNPENTTAISEINLYSIND